MSPELKTMIGREPGRAATTKECSEVARTCG